MATNEGLARLLSSSIERAVTSVLESQRVSRNNPKYVNTCGFYDFVVNEIIFLGSTLDFRCQNVSTATSTTSTSTGTGAPAVRVGGSHNTFMVRAFASSSSEIS